MAVDISEAYCVVADLLTGSIPLPSYTSPEKFIQDAADEIDSKIGFIYHTPVDVTSNSNTSRPARLLLKRLNVALATGKLILAVASGSEDDNLHAYGLHLITEASASLDYISSGQISLDGAAKVDNSTSTDPLGPLVSNGDPESYVDAFYNRVANPNFLHPPFGTQYPPTQGLVGL